VWQRGSVAPSDALTVARTRDHHGSLGPTASRIRPANDRETSRTDGNGWSIESAGQEPDSAIAQLVRSAPTTLSRWRHGFAPRWDYQRKASGQGTSPKSIGSLNRDSNAGYPANIPHRIERSDCAKGCARRGWMHSPFATSARIRWRPLCAAW